MKKLLRKNKGFSLVELIIAFSLLSIIAMAVLAVMNAGTNMFTSVDRELNLQNKSQNAMTQFQQYFMGCSKAICNTDGDITYFAGNNKVYAIKKDGSNLYFGESDTASAATLTADNITDPFCSDVDNFSVAIISNRDKATSIKVTLTLKDESGKTYTASQIFSLRNQPVHIKEPDTSEDEAATMLSTLIKVLEG